MKNPNGSFFRLEQCFWSALFHCLLIVWQRKQKKFHSFAMTSFPLFINLRLSLIFTFFCIFSIIHFFRWLWSERWAIDCKPLTTKPSSLKKMLKLTGDSLSRDLLLFGWLEPALKLHQDVKEIDSFQSGNAASHRKIFHLQIQSQKTSLNTLSFATFSTWSPPNHQHKNSRQCDRPVAKRRKKCFVFGEINETRIWILIFDLLEMREELWHAQINALFL